MNSNNVMEAEVQHPKSTTLFERPGRIDSGGLDGPDGQDISSESPATPVKDSVKSKEIISTPDSMHELRSVGGHNKEMRSGFRSMNAPGPQTFDHKYMPFAGGFAHMASEAAVYRSTRLHNINPTAAVSDDIAYYYTLDSGRLPPAVVAANPDTQEEFVRNTTTETHGGMWRRMMKPIQ